MNESTLDNFIIKKPTILQPYLTNPFNICPECRKKVKRNDCRFIISFRINKNSKREKTQWFHIDCYSEKAIDAFFKKRTKVPVNNSFSIIL